MRGGAQAHLLEADDGDFYVVKFRNNPQHRRILINEWMGTAFLTYLQVTLPGTAIIQISQEFVEAFPEVGITLGSQHHAVTPGWHFGSRFPGDPNTTAVYDFVPDTLLQKVANLTDFLGVLVFDKWVGNADTRQSVFVRAKLREYAPAYINHPLKIGFIALMVDHGYIFNGPHWEYVDSPMTGMYFRPMVYESVRGYNDFQPWLDRVENFPEEIVDQTLRQVPLEWMNGDAGPLEGLLERLMKRRGRVPDLLQECRRGQVNPFPNWKL
ncbi:MAG: HipA family kinase [Bryobacteraceae bacterium]